MLKIDQELTGKQIEKLLKEKNVTRNEIIDRIFAMTGRLISAQAISKWTTGKGLPDLQNMLVLAQILGVRAEDIVVMAMA